METRAFVKEAGKLIDRINRSAETIATPDELSSQRDRIQREINQLLNGLQNPTVPTAYRLRDVAIRAGYTVDQRVLNNLSRFESIKE